jgi:hypothetical protein
MAHPAHSSLLSPTPSPFLPPHCLPLIPYLSLLAWAQVARIKCHIEENVSKGGPVIGDDGAVKAASRPGTATGTRPGASNGTGKSTDSTAQPPTAALVTGCGNESNMYLIASCPLFQLHSLTSSALHRMYVCVYVILIVQD